MLRGFCLGRAPRPSACALLNAGALLLLAAGLAHAAIFPDQIGSFHKSAPKTVFAPDLPLLHEFGLEATEQADYAAPSGKHFIATAWRFQDSTGAMAFFEAHRPPGAFRAQPGRLAIAAPDRLHYTAAKGVLFALSDLAATTSDGAVYAYGNYVFQFTGDLPDRADLRRLYKTVPSLEQSPLPALMDYLPAANLIPNSERYIVGPVSLQRFDPEVPLSAAAFPLGAEAQLGRYKTSKGTMTLAIFNYPTPNIARQQDAEFQKIQGAVPKRTGPLVAVIIRPPDPEAAKRLLAEINYEQNLTWNETVPRDITKDAANMLLSIFTLAGIVLVLCVLGGVSFGGFRVLARKMGWRTAGMDEMIVLHLGDR
jgi:Family of unknown function (DUF6599)